VIPETVLGLVVFAAGAGPGYLYVRLAQARTPRYERTTLEEVTEFVVFGALASGASVLLALALGELTGVVDSTRVAEAPVRYAVTEPARTLAAFASVLLFSYGGVAFVTTKLLHRDAPNISRGETAWYAAFNRMVPQEHGIYATVELRDGRAVAGLVIAYTVDTGEPREIVLARPVDGALWLRNSDGKAVELPDAFMVLRGADILAVSGRYVPAGDGGRAGVETSSRA
jgi:hypothetical protein